MAYLSAVSSFSPVSRAPKGAVQRAGHRQSRSPRFAAKRKVVAKKTPGWLGQLRRWSLVALLGLATLGGGVGTWQANVRDTERRNAFLAELGACEEALPCVVPLLAKGVQSKSFLFFKVRGAALASIGQLPDSLKAAMVVTAAEQSLFDPDFVESLKAVTIDDPVLRGKVEEFLILLQVRVDNNREFNAWKDGALERLGQELKAPLEPFLAISET